MYINDEDKILNTIKNIKSTVRPYPRCLNCPLAKDMSLMYK
jgi:hypothetical protein